MEKDLDLLGGDHELYFVITTETRNLITLSHMDYIQLLENGFYNPNKMDGLHTHVLPVIKQLSDIVSVKQVSVNTIYKK